MKTRLLGIRVTDEFRAQLLKAKETFEKEQKIRCSLSQFVIKLMLENEKIQNAENAKD